MSSLFVRINFFKHFVLDCLHSDAYYLLFVLILPDYCYFKFRLLPS